MNKVVPNVKEIVTNPERGIISFETSNKLGVFYVYYLPYRLKGSRNYPNVVYKIHKRSVLDRTKKVKLSNPKYFTLLRLESIDSFNSNHPMEVIATEDEINRF